MTESNRTTYIHLTDQTGSKFHHQLSSLWAYGGGYTHAATDTHKYTYTNTHTKNKCFCSLRKVISTNQLLMATFFTAHGKCMHACMHACKYLAVPEPPSFSK